MKSFRKSPAYWQSKHFKLTHVHIKYIVTYLKLMITSGMVAMAAFTTFVVAPVSVETYHNIRYNRRNKITPPSNELLELVYKERLSMRQGVNEVKKE